MLRGALLLAIAVVLGVVLLNRFDNGTDPFAQSLTASGKATTTTTTTAAPPVTTTTAATAAPRLRAPADVKVLPANGTGVNRFGARNLHRHKDVGQVQIAVGIAAGPHADRLVRDKRVQAVGVSF